jgi:flagellar secretion chaperone FliS
MTSSASHRPARSVGSPYQMVARLLEGAISRLEITRGELVGGVSGGAVAACQSASLTSAVNIIGALRDSLDLEQGGPLACNLLELYDYMLRRLDGAWAANDAAAVTEVSSLLATILEGWEAIAPEVGEGPALVESC